VTDPNDRAEILARIRAGELDVDRGLRMLTESPAPVAEVPTDALRAGVERHVARLVADEAQIPVGTVLPGRALEDFGFDSVMAVAVVRALEVDFGKLPPTLLFEHQTVAAIAGFLLAEHEQAARSLVRPARDDEDRGTPQEPAPAGRAVDAAPTGSGAVAVIGVSGRFPDADSLDEFWANLCRGRDSISEIPPDRWDQEEHFDPAPGTPGKSYARWGGFLNGVDGFDAELFNISPREAERMDPQERLFLEQAWLAVEDSGSTKDSRAGKQTGVYVGVMYSQYQLLQAEQALLGNHLHLGSSYASIANRVSYVLDLHGPSFAVDSMCSSSLTALHLAREALLRGEVDLAVAGGVNLSIHPAKFTDLSQGRYAATDGRCRSFGEGGDGYVPGEGVAAVVLKRLADAEADGDRVYAVITGSALGHGGKTNGYTVPNPVEQTAVITRAMAEAGVTPDQVTYVEAHGTGTALGDPIEIAALDRALAGRDQSGAPCAVGSVKSNIGHLESAAGIAGLIKVLLQLRHRELAPSLHADSLNPHLDLDSGRLAVQRARAQWEPAAGGRRVAGLSSFGAGGANAHLVIEEHRASAGATVPAGPHLVLLSARTPQRLRALAARVAREADRHRDDPAWLARAARTSRVGRDAWEERLAVVAADTAELSAALDAIARSGDLAAPYRGTVDLGAPAPAGVRGADLATQARNWVRGAAVDGLAADPGSPALVSLPSAPLVRERYWPTLLPTSAAAGDAVRLTPEHPAVRDHVVHGLPVLPAAAVLELARAAGARAGLGAGPLLRQVAFEKPLTVPDTGCRVRVEVATDGADASSFTVRAEDGTTHARGTFSAAATGTPPRIALPAATGNPVQSVYETFSARGLEYGPSAQVLDSLTVIDGCAYGRLRATDSEAGFRPKLLDGALHALIAFDPGLRQVRVPVAVESARVHSTAVPASCWVRATPRPGTDQVFDLDVADDDGQVLIELRGLAVRPSGDQAVVLRADRRESPLPAAGAVHGTVVVLGELAGSAALAADVVTCVPGSAFRAVTERRYELDPTDAEHYRALFAELKGPVTVLDAWQPSGARTGDPFPSSLALCTAVATSARDRVSRVLHVSGGDRPDPAHQAVAGLLRTLAAETGTAYRVVHAHPAADLPAVLRAELAADSANGLVDHDRSGIRREHVLTESEMNPPTTPPYREHGVYLVTGGAGGLGRVLALHLARTVGARLVLTGRRAPDAGTDALLAEVAAAGGQACYVQADTAVLPDVERAVAEAKRRYGALHGVFHLAGVLRDSLIARKRLSTAQQVLAPKISGARTLDAATADLDLFVLFSSAASVLGIAGQADYAYANAYLNHFAETRDRERPGRTVCVAWPLWRGGGMDVTSEAKTRIAERLGWLPLPEQTGLGLLDAVIASDAAVHAVFHGRRGPILAALREDTPPPAASPAGTGGAVAVPAALRDHVRRALAAELKLPAAKLDTARRFEYLGVESVMVMNLTRALAEVFGDLPASVFFEHQTVDQVCAHLASAYPDVVRASFGGSAQPVAPPSSPAVPPARTEVVTPPGPEASGLDDPVAIVGLSGRYPMAPTLDWLWANLVAGRDCVTEVPADRWDHDRYFDPSGERAGTSYSRWGGFLDDIDRFDPRFFAIAPREARLMDPQERLFLETAWHAVEDAGYTRDQLSQRVVGVFAGVMYSQYQLYGADPVMQEQGFVPSSLAASVANRVSYTLDLRGPSIAVDTMCSSSLTALHLARAAILAGDCDEAIAGGVNTIPHPNRYLQLSHGRFASTDGRCRSFGEGGDGYVPGEGVGAVLLKRLSRAIADGDHIYGLVRGSAVNHGGRSNGYTVPTPAAQASVIELAMRRSGLPIDRIGYVEAHGTGTPLGDPIEVDALTRAFTGARGPVPMGSVKSAIGHLESAAGIAALTKVLLQLRHGQLVPSLHAERLNPNIDFGRTPFAVQRHLADWPRENGAPRAAAISSFGAGGSNAHVVIEERIPAAVASEAHGPHVVLLSARTADLLHATARQLADALAPASPADVQVPLGAVTSLIASVLGVDAGEIDADDDMASLGVDAVALDDLVHALAEHHRVGLTAQDVIDLGTPRTLAAHIAAADDQTPPAAQAGPSLRDIAFTLAIGREARAERVAVVAADIADLRGRLTAIAGGTIPDGVARGHVAEDAGRQLATLLGDAHGAAFVASVRAAGDLDRLAELWVSGVDLRTERTGTFADAVRVSLPGSPMDREPHWVPAAPAHPSPRPVSPVAAEPEPAGVVAEAPPARLTETDVESVVVSAMASTLEIPESEFDPDLAHSDLGVDSVLAVEIVDRINRELGSELKPTDFFSHATLRKLVRHIADTTITTLLAPRTPTDHQPAPRRAPTVAQTAPPATASGDVAVIGMSGRFPGARDLDELWANLLTGRDLVREIPRGRWDTGEHFDPDSTAAGKTYSKWGSVLEDVDQFDPDFFGISPREARLMDPQQRLYLMEAWKALEDAGYSDTALDGLSCHAYVGTAMGDYHHLLKAHGVPIEGYTFTGTHPAVLASRLSYHLNLAGPSLAIDTSCSSSLMAVHLACEAIRSGQAELAVAGGVAALSTPELHVLASKAGMLSPTGRCRPFDAAADGFVPGEGVGVVVLKRLNAALRDGDHVHGVIAASGANQDGRSNGLTAPSAPAQAALQTAVHRRFGIDPAEIGYVECHGTGTRLGDPIEIEALHESFGGGLPPRSCALGSIKSNLGHTLTAAGIAGLLKTLLCLKHHTLVPTAHVRALNDYIPFDDGPFHVPTHAQPWQAAHGGARMGAINSFGFSGTNVHVVVREAVLPAAVADDGAVRAVPVSAKTAEALRRKIDDLGAWLAGLGAAHSVRDIAHTLGAGRSHFAVRAVFLARDTRELRERVTRGEQGALKQHGPWADAARDYLAGQDVDWRALDDGEVRTVPMPTYPFADERYWAPGAELPSADQGGDTDPGTRTVRVHPADPIVADHVVDGKPLLPAAGHLAFAHQVLAEVLGSTEITLRRVVWLRPVFVTDAREIEVAVTATAGGWSAFEVRSSDTDGTVVQHSRGEARAGGEHPPAVDLAAVRQRCARSVAAAEHYRRFDRIGVHYGPEFATVTGIQLSEIEALAGLEHSAEQPTIAAGVLDGAIQSVAALHPETDGQRPHVPFAMDQIRLLRPVPRHSHAHIRQEKPGECTITITDDAGRACLVVDGMAYRELKNPLAVRLFQPGWLPAPARPAAESPASVLIVAPPLVPDLAEAITERHPAASVHTAAIDPLEPGALTSALAELPLPDRVYFLGALDGLGLPGDPTAPDLLDRAQETGVRSLLRLVRHLDERGAGERALELVCVTADTLAAAPGERCDPRAAGLTGMVRSLAKEYPAWRAGTLDVRTADLLGDGVAAVADHVVAEQGHLTGDEVALRAGERLTTALHEIPTTGAAPPYRHGGVYVVLGGAGGIGAVLAAHLATTAGATVVLLGRRASDDAVDAVLADVRTAGGHGEYHAVDATDEAAMTAVLADVRRRHGAVHGVFHSAIVLRDGLLARMADADLDAVLAPKVRGSAVLARAVRAALDVSALDFLAFFSSAQSFSGNAGQGNYAAGCTFKDAFAARLAHDGLPVRVVNWGYWGEVGIVAKPGYRKRMQAIGVHSISPAEGMAALDAVIAGDAAQVMPLKAEDRVLDKFGVAPARSSAPWPALTLPPGPDGDRLRAAHTALDALGAALVADALRRLGAFTRPGETREAAKLGADLGVVPAHARLWPTLLDMLVEAGYLDREADALTGTRALAELPERDLDAERERLARDHPEVSAHTELLIACLREYPALLTGTVDPTEVLFPNSSMARVEGVYRGDPLADRLNQVAAAAVAARVERVDGTARVIEVGAGTGGTSASALPALAPHAHRVEYTYTDVSAGFLRHGRKHFGAAHPFTRFERLDIERPPGGQGFDEGGYDVVLAANVLHATEDLRATVGHAASLLRRGGWLVLSETTAFSGFATLTFGLLDGWWRWTDAELRVPGSPLADVATWQSVLTGAGFGRIAALPPATATTGDIGQNVIVAEFAGAALARQTPDETGRSATTRVQAATGSVRRVLAEAIAETLGRAEADLDPDRPFTDYGVDSIILVELVTTLNERLGTELRTTALFDHPTLNELAAFVDNERGPAAAEGDPSDEIDLLRRLAAGELSVEDIHQRLERA
jgi:acyl transferase domain-containing protein/aryl carrier-like protein